MSGYDGWSKSNNALIAESEGKFPMSKAKKIVAKKFGVTQKIAKEALEKVGHCEWHHTSKNYNITYYYDTIDEEEELREAIEDLLEEYKLKNRPLPKNIKHPFKDEFCKHPMCFRSTWGCALCGVKFTGE